MREVTKGVFHTPDMIGRPVWHGRKVGIVRSVSDTKLFVQFDRLPPVGLGAHQLYIACANWESNARNKCRSHVEPMWGSKYCEKCDAEITAAIRRRDNDWG